MVNAAVGLSSLKRGSGDKGPKKCSLADSTISGFKSVHESPESVLGNGGPGMAIKNITRRQIVCQMAEVNAPSLGLLDA